MSRIRTQTLIKALANLCSFCRVPKLSNVIIIYINILSDRRLEIKEAPIGRGPYISRVTSQDMIDCFIECQLILQMYTHRSESTFLLLIWEWLEIRLTLI